MMMANQYESSLSSSTNYNKSLVVQSLFSPTHPELDRVVQECEEIPMTALCTNTNTLSRT